MSRARSSYSYSPDWQIAASVPGTGCLSGFLIPPAAVLLVGVLLALFVKGLNIPVQAAALPASNAVALNIPSQAQATVNQPAVQIASGVISPVFTPEVQYWATSIVRWASAAGVDPNLAATVMQIESCGDPSATSRSGAMGLFQVMPFHFQSGEDGYDPETNALRGMEYLRRSLDKAGGNARLALAGYNGGIGVIGRGEWNWASETVRYVKYGNPIYQDAVSGATTSAAVNEWLGRYGASLCRQAAQRLGLP